MSAAPAARKSRKPAAMTTRTSKVIAASAVSGDTAPLSQKRSASGGARTSVAASVPEPTDRLLGSAAECIAAALNHVVLLRFEPDPKRQAHEPVSCPVDDAQGAAGAAELPAGVAPRELHVVVQDELVHRVDEVEVSLAGNVVRLHDGDLLHRHAGGSVASARSQSESKPRSICTSAR